jgi:hypothetical protein
LDLFHPVAPQQPRADAPVIFAAEAVDDSADIGPRKKSKKVKKVPKVGQKRRIPGRLRRLGKRSRDCPAK